MTTIKSYTDLEQSKRLAEILPIESADMYYGVLNTTYANTLYDSCDIKYFNFHEYTPCWSLAVLLEYLREHHLFPDIINADGCILMDVTFYDEDETEEKTIVPLHFVRAEGKNIIDACYDIILKLHKINML